MSRQSGQRTATTTAAGGIAALIAEALGLVPTAPPLLRFLVAFAFGLVGGVIVTLLIDLVHKGREVRESAPPTQADLPGPPAGKDSHSQWGSHPADVVEPGWKDPHNPWPNG